MKNVAAVGRGLIPIEQIALVEPFEPTANPQLKTEEPFKGTHPLTTALRS